MNKITSELNKKQISWDKVARNLNLDRREAFVLITKNPEQLSIKQAKALANLTGSSLEQMFA